MAKAEATPERARWELGNAVNAVTVFAQGVAGVYQLR